MLEIRPLCSLAPVSLFRLPLKKAWPQGAVFINFSYRLRLPLKRPDSPAPRSRFRGFYRLLLQLNWFNGSSSLYFLLAPVPFKKAWLPALQHYPVLTIITNIKKKEQKKLEELLFTPISLLILSKISLGAIVYFFSKDCDIKLNKKDYFRISFCSDLMCKMCIKS